MSVRASSRFATKFLLTAAAVAVLGSATPALAVDPVIDPMRPSEGLTATAPRQAERETRRDMERSPTLTQRFGLPPVSGPLPPLLPPLQQPPVLYDPGPNAAPPPPLRARQPRDRDG